MNSNDLEQPNTFIIYFNKITNFDQFQNLHVAWRPQSSGLLERQHTTLEMQFGVLNQIRYDRPIQNRRPNIAEFVEIAENNLRNFTIFS